MGLRRVENWESRLRDQLETARGMPFIWGSHDCATFTADCILAMTGTDLAERWRGRYTCRNGALRLVRRFTGARGYLEVLAPFVAAAHDLPECPVSYAQRGDVALLVTESGQSLGIVALDGQRVAAVDTRGLDFIPLSVWSRAWRIG